MKAREEPENPEVRSDVGARNPFARAEAILLEKKEIEGPIPWEELSPKEARKLLEKVFQVPYEHLFDPDPEYGSPLFWIPGAEKSYEL